MKQYYWGRLEYIRVSLYHKIIGNSLGGVRFAKSTAEGNSIEALDGGRQTLEKKCCFSNISSV